MAEPVAPVTVCGVGLFCIPFLEAMGLNPINMACGLAGVVVVQAFLPSKDDPKELRKIILFGTASMIVAGWGGPLIAAGLLGAMPDSLAWIKTVPPDHLKKVAAGLAGGFAHPLVLWARSFIPVRTAPQAKE